MSGVLLVAQAAGEDGGGGFGNLFLFIAVIFLAFYFIILRPQKRDQQNREKLLSTISKGDKVVSAGGIHGTVTDASSKETLEVEVARNVRLIFNRASISVVESKKKPGEDKKSDDKAADDKKPDDKKSGKGGSKS